MRRRDPGCTGTVRRAPRAASDGVRPTPGPKQDTGPTELCHQASRDIHPGGAGRPPLLRRKLLHAPHLRLSARHFRRDSHSAQPHDGPVIAALGMQAAKGTSGDRPASSARPTSALAVPSHGNSFRKAPCPNSA